jgi:two-component system sensor histidine kinase PilS (NtrC family)
MAEVSELIIRRCAQACCWWTATWPAPGQRGAMLLLGDTGDHPDGHRNISVDAPDLARRLARWRSQGLPTKPRCNSCRHARSGAALRPPARGQRPDADLPGRHLAGIAPRRIDDAGHAGTLLGQPRPRDPQPVGAINYAVQLLEESHELPTSDRACWKSSASRACA